VDLAAVREVDDRFDLIGVGPVALDQLLLLVVVAHVWGVTMPRTSCQ
jgi:hypothetical protein